MKNRSERKTQKNHQMEEQKTKTQKMDKFEGIRWTGGELEESRMIYRYICRLLSLALLGGRE